MAIFTSDTDRTLPMVTQIFQVDADNPEEVAEIMARLVKMDDPRLTLLSAKERARMVSEFIKVCRLLQSVIVTLHDEGGITMRQKDGIEEFFEHYRTGIKMPDIKELRLDSKSRRLIIPVNLIKETHRFDDDALIPASVLFGFIPALYKEIQEGKGNLRRCVECQSVFVERRAGQQFCSYRCNGRTRTRRYRENLRAETPRDGEFAFSP